jgi:hypothetical protein
MLLGFFHPKPKYGVVNDASNRSIRKMLKKSVKVFAHGNIDNSPVDSHEA